ncbi:MAG: protein-L-isoaspartate(D-aspartate) O-methyltransferase [Planctomycetota bacterium]
MPAFPETTHTSAQRTTALRTAVVVCTLTLALATPAIAQQKWELHREVMVRTALEAEGISNPRVLAAMRKVPRHEFVRSTEKAQAYEDTALPIGHQQTISPPYIVAYMTETLDPQPDDKVLEIGTGSGYQAAVLGELVRDVYTIEIVSPLAKQATRRLAELGFANVHVKDGDGYQGWPEHAPFNRIIVTCSPENVPQPLVDQLAEGGQMIIPMGERYQQAFHLFKKVDGKLESEKLISTLFVPMTGASEDLRRILPDPANPTLVNGSFEIDSNEDGRVDGWHYQRKTAVCTEDVMEGKQYLRFENTSENGISQALQGTAIDGRTIGSLRLQYWVRCKSIVPGPNAAGQASIVVHFYDNVRREISTVQVGKWRGSLDWQDARSVIPVPPNAKEMIIRLGLNEASGQLDLDDIRMLPVRR